MSRYKFDSKNRIRLNQKLALRHKVVIAVSVICVFAVSIVYLNIGTPKETRALPPVTVTATSLSFTSASLTSGVLGALNSVHRFSSVATGIDAWITLKTLNNGGLLSSIDMPSSTSGYDAAFQPVITADDGTSGSPRTSYVEWTINFKKSGSSVDTVLDNVAATAIDIDGNSDLQEWVEAFNVSSYATYSPTSITVSTTASSVKATSGTTSFSDIDSSNRTAMFQLNWMNVSSITYRMGAINKDNSRDRQFSLYFTSFFSSSTPLPISLSKFEAKPLNEKVMVRWITASENDNDFFTIERSANNITFEPLAKINGAGNSSELQTYTYTDNKPLPGNNYYRLRQTDFNGKSETFDPVRVNLKSSKINDEVLKITSANPFQNYISLSYSSVITEEVEIKLYTSAGSELKSIRQTAEEGVNTFTISSLENLEPGIYFVSVVNSTTKTKAIKIVKR